MQIIQQLDANVANKIAAGEVITEPVSVVKELVENALDAGAREILVEIRGGGLESIQVVDDGHGIYAADADRLFLRHATSKLSSARDLYQIGSLGFRGEALASIAAISKVSIHSRHRDELQGFHLIQYGANRLRQTRIAKTPGTSVLVEDLFFNTPVRENFLAKSTQLERAVNEFMRAFALGHPEIRFRYMSDDRLIFVTHGDGSYENAIYDILGPELSDSLIQVADEGPNFQLHGYLSGLSYTRSNRNYQFFYINGRLVDNPELKDLIRQAYEGLLMLRRFPVVLLWIQTDYSLVDVNVHPRKLEVRLSESLRLKDHLPERLRGYLRQKIQPVRLESKSAQSVPTPNRTQTTPIPIESAEPKQPKAIDYAQISLQELKLERQLLKETATEQLQNDQRESFDAFIAGLEPIGQFAASYLLFEKAERLILLDQHAAHEKVLYERFMQLFKDSEFHSQILLVPISLQLMPEELRVLEDGLEVEQFGYQLEHFGGNQIIIRAIPHILSPEQARYFFEELLTGERSPSGLEREAIVSRSCKAAIKAHHRLEPIETKALLEQLRTLQDPFTCPHGRPIFVEISRREIERRFERT